MRKYILIKIIQSTMETTANKDTPRLIEYIVLCGIKPGALIDYISKLDEASFPSGLSKDSLRQNHISPRILSTSPTTEKEAFPLSQNFVDVFNRMHTT